MRRLVFIFMVASLTGLWTLAGAQDKAELSDRTLSAEYKQEIRVVQSEIKTLRLKLKSDQSNLTLQNELTAKEAELNDLKAKKKVIDDAIKSKAASEKAIRKAEKAKEDAEKAQIKAEKAAKNANELKEKEKGN